jgi:mono/diheme cytochrome c family protein
MRERIAKGILLLTLVVLTGLSFVFARMHNPDVPAGPEPVRVALPAPAIPPATPEPDAAPQISSEVYQRGRGVYARERCATCHSIAGEGNPRSPLDGIAGRLAPDELEAWTTGTGPAAERLPAGVVRRKERYRSLPEEDLQALVQYLSTLGRASAGQPLVP